MKETKETKAEKAGITLDKNQTRWYTEIADIAGKDLLLSCTADKT